uniref:Uncharacterized protein n=1 Tax=Picea sitchensis TaxID=3332 RepID=A9NVW4_PICSI|nr:unknown [Picea sitchensis]
MGAFKNWQGSQRLIHLLIIQLIVWFGWLSNIALALTGLGETVTGSLSLPGIGIACIGNLAVFVTSLLRGRLDLEMGARDVLATMRGPKLEDISNGFGRTTSNVYKKVSVVMLSSHTPNLSIRQFMKYISNAYNVHSIILQCFPVKSSASQGNTHKCKCVVFSAVEAVIILLADQIPGTLKRLSDNLFLLPSQDCLEKGCHGCNQGLLYAKDESGNNKLTEDESGNNKLTKGEEIKRSAVVETLNHLFQNEEEEHKCICIPLCPSGYDYWTKLLSRSFGVRDTTGAVENFSTASLIVPRLAEVLVNLVLTVWFRVDGFSSSLVARRAIRNYVVDSKGSGFAANAFLTKAVSKVQPIPEDKTKYVCHVLTFRGTLGIRTFSIMVGIVNLFCSITWVVLIALNGSVGKWYDSHSIPLSKPRVVVTMASIGIMLAMDCLHLYLFPRSTKFLKNLKDCMVLAVILSEIICLVASSVIMGTLGIEVFGKWLYIALHVLVWVKWGVGSYLLGEYPPEYESEFHYGNGILVYSSVFLLSSVLAGIRGDWHYSLSMND